MHKRYFLKQLFYPQTLGEKAAQQQNGLRHPFSGGVRCILNIQLSNLVISRLYLVQRLFKYRTGAAEVHAHET